MAQQHSDWKDGQCLEELIKTIIFELKLLDPKDYNKECIITLKQSVNQFLGVIFYSVPTFCE
jgi:hypothetical protein